MDMRIGRFLSRLGLCSRRESDVFLKEHEVVHWNKRITALNYYLPKDSVIWVDGKEYSLQKEQEIYLLHKPLGYVCSHKSFQDQPSIFTLLPKDISHYFFAGRLDANSTGLVVVTNDGDLVYSLTHPSKKTMKEYLVHCSRPLSTKEQEKLLAGVWDKKEKLKANSIVQQKPAHYLLRLHTGKNREVRRLFASLQIRVLSLQRLQMGSFSLASLPEGKWQKVQ